MFDKLIFFFYFKLFNLNKLNTSLDLIGRQYKTYIPGVTSPFLYIGSWASSFAYHIEDLDLLSISYLHSGSKKVWYVIPPRFGHQFECLMKGKLELITHSSKNKWQIYFQTWQKIAQLFYATSAFWYRLRYFDVSLIFPSWKWVLVCSIRSFFF